MSYNLSFMDNTTNMFDVVAGINTASGNVFGIIILTMVYIFVFASTMEKGNSTAMISGGVASVAIGSLLWFGGLITWSILIIPVLLLVTGIIVKAFEG